MDIARALHHARGDILELRPPREAKKREKTERQNQVWGGNTALDAHHRADGARLASNRNPCRLSAS